MAAVCVFCASSTTVEQRFLDLEHCQLFLSEDHALVP